MNEDILKTLLGIGLGATVWLATGNCLAVDGATGMTCSEYNNNPNQDVYYIVESSDFNEDVWGSAHQDPETVRWNNDRTKFILKYNAKDVPREQTKDILHNSRPLGNPMDNEEILTELELEEWRGVDDGGVVKENLPKETEFATDDVGNP